jgi:hypothetical protein
MSLNFPNDAGGNVIRCEYPHIKRHSDDWRSAGNLAHGADHDCALSEIAEISITEADYFVLVDCVADGHWAVSFDGKPHGVMAANRGRE